MSEIDKFASAVLAHHYPGVPNYGDMTKFEEWPDATIDVLVGGTPCQSFSIAGLRGGLDDARGNLMLVYSAIARKYRPKWLVWENVPGCLSSDGGRDFASLLGLLSGKRIEVPPGGWKSAGVVPGYGRAYGLAWRVLDAQFVRIHGFERAVPQRRRRVFVVGHLGDWRRSASVLFERESVCRNTPPRRQAWKATAPTLSSRTRGGGGLGTDFDCGGKEATHTLNTSGNIGVAIAFDETQITSADNRCNPHPGDACHPMAAGARPPTIAFSAKDHGGDAMGDLSPTLRAGGFDKSHANAGVMPAIAFDARQSYAIQYGEITGPLDTDGSSMGILVSGDSYACPQEANSGTLLRGVRDALGAEAFAQWGLGILDTLQSSEILRSALHGSELRPAAFSRRWVVDCALSREETRAARAVQSLREAAGEGCASQGWQPSQQFAGELGAYLSGLSQPGAQAERFMRDLWFAGEGIGILRQALSAVQKARRPERNQVPTTQDVHGVRSASQREGALREALHGRETSWRVRRLLVEECEFLQGFPRGYTMIPYPKPKWAPKFPDRVKHAADGPRYRSLGNSMACNVMRWLGTRIQMVDNIPETP